MPARTLLAILAALVAASLGPSAADAGSLRFSTPVRLAHGDPQDFPLYQGGEPSITFDPSGDGHVYVVAPQGIPSAVQRILGAADSFTGVGYWASSDHGRTFPVSGTTGSLLGGGDSDVEVLADHTVLVADLEAAATALCRSHDFARSFPDCDRGLTLNQQGPVNDRPWLAQGRKGEIYLVYHDYVAGLPILLKSTDGARTFAPCGSVIDPGGPAAKLYSVLQGTLVSKPVVNAAGDLFIQFSMPDPDAAVIGGPINHLFMAVARGGCSAATRFENHLIYQAAGASLAKLFQAQAIDGAGQLYVAAAGNTKGGQSQSRLWLFTSTDGGRTWSTPIDVAPASVKGNVFPTLTGGQGRGEVAVGWFGTDTSGDPNNRTNQWRFHAAVTYDGGQTFNHATVTPDVIHYGEVCDLGLFCGLLPGQPSNRNLADFASMATDPSNGCVAIALPGDPYNRPDINPDQDNGSSSAYVSLQQDSSTCLTRANAGKPADAVGCLDRAAPRSRFVARGRTASRRRGVTLAGRTTDRGCGARGRGRVRRVLVSLGRKGPGSRCRFAQANGRLGRPVSCARTIYLRARGTTTWRFRYAHRLPAGRYFAWSRAVDASGNVERKSRRRNLTAFRIR